MTLKEAADFYNSQNEKINDANKHIQIIGKIVNDNSGQLCEDVVRIRKDILIAISDELMYYRNYLEAALYKEI